MSRWWRVDFGRVGSGIIERSIHSVQGDPALFTCAPGMLLFFSHVAFFSQYITRFSPGHKHFFFFYTLPAVIHAASVVAQE